jgi:hypothetical protein
LKFAIPHWLRLPTVAAELRAVIDYQREMHVAHNALVRYAEAQAKRISVLEREVIRLRNDRRQIDLWSLEEPTLHKPPTLAPDEVTPPRKKTKPWDQDK